MADKFDGELLAEVHGMASDLHEVGAISDKRMKQYDKLCLNPNTNFHTELKGEQSQNTISRI